MEKLDVKLPKVGLDVDIKGPKIGGKTDMDIRGPKIGGEIDIKGPKIGNPGMDIKGPTIDINAPKIGLDFDINKSKVKAWIDISGLKIGGGIGIKVRSVNAEFNKNTLRGMLSADIADPINITLVYMVFILI